MSFPKWTIWCSWFTVLVLCVTWGLGAWWSVVSSTPSWRLAVLVNFQGCNCGIKQSKCVCFQWTTSAVCLSSFFTVTIRNRWTDTASAGWSSCLFSGTRPYMEMPPEWTGEEQLPYVCPLDPKSVFHEMYKIMTVFLIIKKSSSGLLCSPKHVYGQF